MTALDVGCGPGFFSVELARMVGNTGRVIAADLQDGMLQRLACRIEGTELAGRIGLVKCDQDNINVKERVDFILTFYMVHEVPDKTSFFGQLTGILNDDGQFLIVEPKLFDFVSLSCSHESGFNHPGTNPHPTPPIASKSEQLGSTSMCKLKVFSLAFCVQLAHN
jgi:ubiquinone/menaquinone biosynthesis C-methylase UbiE